MTVDQVDRARTLETAQSEALKQAESQLRLSRAALQSAQAQYERSGAGLDESKAQHVQAKHAVTTLEPLVNQRGARESAVKDARYNLNNCRVYAPFDARVTNLNISEGAYAHIGQQVFTLIDARTWWAIGNFREGQLQHIAPGMRADVYVLSRPDVRFSAVVDSIGFGVTPDPDVIGRLEPGLPDEQRTLNWVHLASRYPVRVRVHNPTPELFRVGESAVVKIRAAARRVAEPSPPSHWFLEFLKEELSPYPGRGALVARIVVAATIVMILTLVFRLPYGAYGTIFAMTISRENAETTVNAAKTIIIAFGLSALYVLAGAALFLVDPTTRFFWVIGAFFLMFYALRILNNYTAAARFGYLIIITIPLWDEHISSGQRVENTLWAFGVISLASIIAALCELVYANLKPQNDLVQSIEERLVAVEDLLNSCSAAGFADGKTQQHLTSLALAGTSRMRRFLQRSDWSPHYAEQMGAVVALVGRLIDIAANLTNLNLRVFDEDRARIRALADKIAGIRAALLKERIPSVIDLERAPYRLPLLRELEATASLIPAVFTGSQSLSAFAPKPAGGDPPSKFFVRDAFSNAEHVKFALRGCLAASLCYIIYNAKDWPGISTAVTTCFLTALSTIGSSHQKQILRIAGAIVGGLLLGIGAQIFILPYLDSVTGFTLLFLTVTIPAVWVTTSGPRLSYFGV